MEADWAAGSHAPTVVRGEVTDAAGAWRVTPAGDGAELAFRVGQADLRRCYALGFVITARDATRLESEPHGLDVPVPSAPAIVQLSGGTTYAGIVEIAPDPYRVERVEVRLRGDIEGLIIYDLFLISYG
jgi:hypothetical protein